MTRLPSLLMSIVAVLAAAGSAAEAVDPGTVADEVRRAGVDLSRAVHVSGARLRAGLATITLSDGVIVPSTAVAGRAVEFVFLGHGRIGLEAPDAIEAGQLELFTGAADLDESFERAVFVIALDAASAAFGRGGGSPDAARTDEARTLFTSWFESPERRLLDVEARIYADGVGDSLAAGFFCGYFEGLRLGRFLYVVDPLADEQATLGQFVRPELSRRQEKQARRSIEEAQRKGKLIGLEVDDLGIWDTWLSSTLPGADGQPIPGSRGIEPEHYEINAALRGKALDLEATAVVTSRVLVDGLAAVAFNMNPDLTPIHVVDRAGDELRWYRSRNELVVALAAPVAAGQELEIGIAYTGSPIEKVATGAFIQRDTTGWYPHAGIIDRATYTVTVEWPEELELVAPGSLEDDGRGETGHRRQRWRLDHPAIGFSFELGRYDVAVGRAGDITIDVAVDRIGSRADHELAEAVLAAVIDVMEYYAEVFGPFPLDRLQVVSSPRSFSQGLLGFVTLSTAAVIDWDMWGPVFGIEDRRTVIAHELAHQWWGNLVGWRGYRDQWISEAMANYAALLWARNRVADTPDVRLGAGPTADWQSDLLQTTADGRPIESLGPLVVGARLNSSISGSAYPAIVYKKGAVVLDMLSMYFGNEKFEKILREIVDFARDRVLSTDNFLGAIAKLGGADLTWFRRQYVDGTGLPEVGYSYTVEALRDGSWAVVGTAIQQAPYRYLFRVAETARAGLDVIRVAEVGIDIADSVLVVPFQIGISGRPEAVAGGRPLLAGRVLVAGASSPFRLETDHRPEVFWLDRDERVFGRFFATDRWPKMAAFSTGLRRGAAGDPDGARESYRQALGAAVAVVPPGWEDLFRGSDVASEGERLDARIRLALTRLDLDAGRLQDAARELRIARDLIASRDRWLLDDDLLVVESRLDLLSGDAGSAFKRLKKRVLGKRGAGSPEIWALVAIAAHEVGAKDVLDQATERAEELGVDLGPLARRDSGDR
jgi:hypothetical protein